MGGADQEKKLNIHANAFIPNVNAPLFVPTWMHQPPPPPRTTPHSLPFQSPLPTTTTSSSSSFPSQPHSSTPPPPLSHWDEDPSTLNSNQDDTGMSMLPYEPTPLLSNDVDDSFNISTTLPVYTTHPNVSESLVTSMQDLHVSQPSSSSVSSTSPKKKPPLVSSSSTCSATSTNTNDLPPLVDLPVSVPTLNEEDQKLMTQFFATQKERLNVVFIGHVDAGKSTMGGHLLYLTGMVDKRTLEKNERQAKEAGRESWYLSWALDTNKEERAKGKTVETGRAYFETPTRKYTILDAPGHKNYVPSMIQGAAEADVAILVISARRGEFETGFEGGGQTREHAMLVKTAGVKKLVIAINKMDDPTVQWSETRYLECKEKLLPFLKKECKFNPKTDIVFLPVSGYSGANLKDRMEASLCPFYQGPSLLEILDTLPMEHLNVNAPLILPVSEKFKDMGTLIAGKIESGWLKKGQPILVMPTKLKADVVQVLVDEEEVPAAQQGEHVHVKLRGVEEEDIVPGSVVCSVSHPLPCVSVFDAQLLILTTERIITAGYQAVMHLHHAVEEITLAALLHTIDKKTGKRTVKPPRFINSGSMCIARIETNHPICIDTFKNTPQMGRFILRLNTVTVAVGKVVKLVTE